MTAQTLLKVAEQKLEPINNWQTGEEKENEVAYLKKNIFFLFFFWWQMLFNIVWTVVS